MVRWLVLATFLGAEASASAGALGQVVNGIHGKAGGSPPASPGAGPKPPPGGHVQPPPPGSGSRPGQVVIYPRDPYGWVYWPPPLAVGYYAYASPYGAPVGIYEEAPPSGPPPEPAFLEAYLGAQSVQDSDHSISFDVRFGRAWLALGVHDTAFFERVAEQDRTLRLDLWGIGPGLRLLHDDANRLWLELGLAGVRSRPEAFYGGTAALRVDHDLTDDLAVDVLGRGYAFGHDLRALELGVGLRWSILRLSWRQVEFNVGPPLRGPELGVALLF